MKYLILTLLLSIGAYAQPVEPIDSIPQGPPTPPQAEIYVFIPNIITRWGSLVYRNDDYQNDFYGTELADGVYAFHIRVYDGSRYRDYFKMITIVQ